MAVKMRLTRIGAKKAPFYRVIVAVVLAILALALKIFVVFLLPVILIIFVVKLIMDYFDR